MTTIIQIKGADFSGKGLPVVTPLFTDGLIGAFRPSKSFQNTIDLSNMGATVNLIGNPIFHENYIECDTANGLVTNLNETTSMTYAFVARTKAVNGKFDSFLGGSYNGGRGLSMYRTSAGVTSQSFSKRTTDNTYQNEMKRIALSDLESTDLTKWGFWLVSIDAINQKLTGFNSEYGFIDLTTAARDYSDRDGFSRLMYVGKPSYPAESAYPAKSHIAEALFYNKGLVEDEILNVYRVSKLAMSTKNILI